MANSTKTVLPVSFQTNLFYKKLPCTESEVVDFVHCLPGQVEAFDRAIRAAVAQRSLAAAAVVVAETARRDTYKALDLDCLKVVDLPLEPAVQVRLVVLRRLVGDELKCFMKRRQTKYKHH